ncbi:MAG: hypothetical protein ACE5KZ_08835 [Candidatus Scalinduaceae bacterium]
MNINLEVVENKKIDIERPAYITEKLSTNYSCLQLSSNDNGFYHRHFMLQKKPLENCYICDVENNNKTYFEKKTKDIVELVDGDIIKVGSAYLKIHILPDEKGNTQEECCIKCCKKLKELSDKSINKIYARDFTCLKCRKKEHLLLPQSEKEKENKRTLIRHVKEKPLKQKVIEHNIIANKLIETDDDKEGIKEQVIGECKSIMTDSGIVDVALSLCGCGLFLFYQFFSLFDPILFGVDFFTLICFCVKISLKNKTLRTKFCFLFAADKEDVLEKTMQIGSYATTVRRKALVFTAKITNTGRQMTLKLTKKVLDNLRFDILWQRSQSPITIMV